MARTKLDRKVNKVVRDLNKSLAADVFGNRFEVRQIRKTRGEYDWQYYQYELVDNLEPERNQIISWMSGFEITTFGHLAVYINDFIIRSDFWKLYKANQENN